MAAAEKMDEGDIAISADRSTVDRILYNALEHFSKHGYSGASVREITQASQVTKPTLYYYFKNKEELYRRLAEACFNEAINVLVKASRNGATAHQSCLEMIKSYNQFARERFIVARFLHLMDTSPRRDAPETEFSDFTKRAYEEFKKVVRDGVQKGEISDGDTEGVSCAVMGVFQAHVGTLLSRTSLSSEFDGVEQALRIIFRRA